MRTSHSCRIVFLLALFFLYGCSDGTDTPALDATVTIANLNVLHGFDCDPPVPADGDQCRIAERVALLGQHLIAAGCPDLVTLQEIVNRDFVQRSPTEQAGPLDSWVDLLNDELDLLQATCGFRYEMVYLPFLQQVVAETDEEMVLSRYAVSQANLHVLHSALYDIPGDFLIFARHVLHATVQHPTGPIDVYTTHMSSGSDGASNDCNSFEELIPGTGIGPDIACPVECDAGDTVRACQAEQIALLVERTRGAGHLALITGDFNAQPGSSEYQSMMDRGWVDSHVALGVLECNPASGEGCTSGRSSNVESLEDPALQVTRRIDYIFAAFAEEDAECLLSDGGDVFGRGHFQLDNAGLFAAEPNPFTEQCGEAPLPICWTSDHSGNYARLRCTNSSSE